MPEVGYFEEFLKTLKHFPVSVSHLTCTLKRYLVPPIPEFFLEICVMNQPDYCKDLVSPSEDTLSSTLSAKLPTPTSSFFLKFSVLVDVCCFYTFTVTEWEFTERTEINVQYPMLKKMRVFLNGFYLTVVHYPEVYPDFVEPEVFKIWESQFKNMKLGMKANIQF